MKNILIVALVGISFLTSGFLVGLRLAPMPKKPVHAAVAVKAAPKAVDPKVAFSVDSLKRASENMQSVNEALQARERAVSAREKAAAQKEDELAAERAALDRLHAQFKTLYGQFQQRLQLVTETETGALERQVTLFDAMDPAQSVDLVRSLDDRTVTRLFALMEDKPLAKIVSAWKQKYPADMARLLGDLNGIGRVVAKAKIDMPDMPPAADTGLPAVPTSTDVATPPSAVTPDATPASAAPAASSPDAAAPAADGSISGHEPYANAGTPPPDLGAPDAPATPPAPASAPDTAAPAAPSSDQDQTTPPPDSSKAAPTPGAAPAGNSSSASTESSLLESPGETAARAAAPRTTHDDDSTPPPSEFTPPTPTMRLAHDKPTRFASARNN